MGVENVLVLANVDSGQHITLTLRQGSDGLEPIYVENIEDKETPTEPTTDIIGTKNALNLDSEVKQGTTVA